MVTGLLCAALAGCGSVVASTSAAAPPGTPLATATPPVGCASVNLATMVTVFGTMHLMVPAGGGSTSVTQRNRVLVRALFRDFCAAVTHPVPPGLVLRCPADFGTEYLGTFYDGDRILASFTYAATGCERVSLTAAGKTQSTMVYGRAAAAAPHLAADMAAVLGLPKRGLTLPGGPDQPA